MHTAEGGELHEPAPAARSLALAVRRIRFIRLAFQAAAFRRILPLILLLVAVHDLVKDHEVYEAAAGARIAITIRIKHLNNLLHQFLLVFNSEIVTGKESDKSVSYEKERLKPLFSYFAKQC